jgi:two-component system NtrC family sensor kinase
MPKGGRLFVRSALDPDRTTVEITIRDTGHGIPPDVLSKVLDPFFTTKEKGTGLGLSVVYGVVERHGGRLSIESAAGEGTAVTVRLPVAPVTAGEAVAAAYGATR